MSKKCECTNEVTNFYEKMSKKFKRNYHNPNYGKSHFIKVPFRSLIIGGSGSMKTTVAVELIQRFSGTFQNISLICKSAHEPLYEYLADKIPPSHLQIYEGLNNAPKLEDLDPDIQHLVIFDDIVAEKNQRTPIDYFIRGRKWAKGVSIIYITQSYFKTPKTIRLNVNYFFIKRLSSVRDLNMILSDFAFPIKKEELISVYKECTKNKLDFLFIDIDHNKFGRNFLQLFDM